MLTSPHGDNKINLSQFGWNWKTLAHNWEYYMTGAFGEEIVQYKGFQTIVLNGVGME